MMSKVIVDTNIVVGLYDKKDVWHEQAKVLAERFRELSTDLIILDCVANETFTVLARRLKERKTQKLLMPILKKVKADFPKDKITRSYQLLETYYDEVVNRVLESKGKLNFHDALIVTIAIHQDISFIASFDENFDDAKGIIRIFNFNQVPSP